MNIYGGFTLPQWVQLYTYCHNTDAFGGISQWCYPNGLSLLEQPNYLIDIFGIVQQQLELLKKQKMRLPGKKGK